MPTRRLFVKLARQEPSLATGLGCLRSQWNRSHKQRPRKPLRPRIFSLFNALRLVHLPPKHIPALIRGGCGLRLPVRQFVRRFPTARQKASAERKRKVRPVMKEILSQNICINRHMDRNKVQDGWPPWSSSIINYQQNQSGPIFFRKSAPTRRMNQWSC